MICMVLAAGYATRLYPLTENFPKPLLAVGEKTILDWLVDDIVTTGKVDEFIVMPTGDNIAKFEGAVVLNEVSAFVFKQLENPVSRDDLLAAMLNEYDVDEATAAADLDVLLEKFADMGVLEK